MGSHNNPSHPSEGTLPLESKTATTRKPRKQGRGFFLTLLIVSGVVIVFLTVLAVKGREIHNFTFKKFVINKALVALLPSEYTLEEAEHVRETVYRFYDNAKAEQISDADLLEVSNRIQTIMTDDQITDEEAKGLLALIGEKKAKPGSTD
ncbi:MAG: hypothetical protein MPW14_17665 [Candidatus Manganitrophus sp.]|nr:hypothetical protein [Candidatus Manganitrophus sp.]MDC4223146.1 hypothetical protein [Candidatus Manganitrophus sp.]WDT69438.1 MAG: hypothetical protein MPW17_11630 [Candidatus Manganitrophus sp.]WDT78971.1 MAG: hypothetical protein MPW14_17665 [Candidatus Manganitrophus sp.]